MEIRLKRAYDTAARSDGPRILVDRIWPRGVAREDANIAHWLKGLSPSTEWRKWFNHDPDKWSKFCERYLKELQSDDAAKDTEHNNAVALRNFVLNDRC